MLRKMLAFLLGLVLCITGFPVIAFATTEETTTKPTIIETSDIVMATQEVEGNSLACEYIKDTGEYFLCINESKVELDVRKNDNAIFVTIADHPKDIYETKVVAQSVTFVTYTGVVLTAIMVYASRDIIVAAVQATVDAASTVIDVSINALITTLNAVRSNQITASNVSAKSESARQVAIAAITTIKQARQANEERYWSASIVNGEIVPGKEISKSEAISRLKSGYDVFTTTSLAAANVCKEASPKGRSIPHTAHVQAEGYYYHFHPDGIKWYKNSNYQPHCWYIL